MKLKKIVSLALAGVLAVSMLAGCNTTDVKPDTDNDDVVVTPSANSAETLYAALSPEARRNVSAVANADLDTALKNAVDKYFNDAETAKYAAVFDVAQVGYGRAGDARNTALGKDVMKSMDYADDIIANLNSKDDTSKKTVVEVYAVNASVTDADILEQLGKKMSESISNLPVSSNDQDNDPKLEKYYDYNYEISVSVMTATGKIMGIDTGVKYVAVAVVKIPVAA